jgi:hypothetical protein
MEDGRNNEGPWIFIYVYYSRWGEGGGEEMDGARLIKRRTRVQSHEGPVVAA